MSFGHNYRRRCCFIGLDNHTYKGGKRQAPEISWISASRFQIKRTPPLQLMALGRTWERAVPSIPEKGLLQSSPWRAAPQEGAPLQPHTPAGSQALQSPPCVGLLGRERSPSWGWVHPWALAPASWRAAVLQAHWWPEAQAHGLWGRALLVKAVTPSHSGRLAAASWGTPSGGHSWCAQCHGHLGAEGNFWALPDLNHILSNKLGWLPQNARGKGAMGCGGACMCACMRAPAP